VPADLIHLVRHGEVHNPRGVLYGRLPEFHLSELGHRMAAETARALTGRPITRLVASPLVRAQESARPFAEATGLELGTDERLIEPWNRFEGGTSDIRSRLRRPEVWPWLVNPWLPSWGEPYGQVARRMIAAVDAARLAVDSGEVVLVSHQLPIVMVQRAVAALPLHHDPRQRRCALSSVTTLRHYPEAERGAPRYLELDYREPAADLLAGAVDRGAV